MERVRQQLLLGIRNETDDPQTVASRAWLSLALPGDPYARDKSGTGQSVMAIGPDDLSAAHRRIFGRKTLQVSAVGDITAAELGALLDRVFLDLPEGEGAPPLPPVAVTAVPQTKVITRDIPQSIIIFGHGGILRRDPDFIPAYIMSEILGGGGFGSRLTTEVREKRGLTYGIGAGFLPMERVGLFIGSLSTRNDKAGEAMELVKAEFRRMAEEGPTQQELDEAKTYLTGSYALRFTSGNAIAGQLLGLQQQGFGPDYVERRNGLIEAVTLDQVKAQAKRLLHPDKMIVTVVGKPEGLN
jgi:zinc protease